MVVDKYFKVHRRIKRKKVTVVWCTQIVLQDILLSQFFEDLILQDLSLFPFFLKIPDRVEVGFFANFRNCILNIFLMCKYFRRVSKRKNLLFILMHSFD